MRLSRSGIAENRSEDVRAVLAKKILEELPGSCAIGGAAYQFLERGADRRTDFHIRFRCEPRGTDCLEYALHTD